ncbi:MAG: hypothetical protein U1E65_09845 [Myxococcota bacterium]
MIPALLVLSTTVSIQLVEASGLEVGASVEITGLVSRAVAARTGWPQMPFDPEWATLCDGPDCRASSIPLGHEAVSLRVYRGATRTRIVASRRTEREELAHQEIDLSADAAAWRGEIEGLVDTLYSEVPRPLPEVQFIPETLEPPSWQWWTLGAGVTAGVGGLIFGILSASAKDTLVQAPLPGSRAQAYADRQFAFGLTADILFAVAGAALITGGAGLIWDH